MSEGGDSSLRTTDEDKLRDAERPLARFLRSSRQVAQTTGRIKYGAFLPAPDDDTSVFQVNDLGRSEVAAIARRELPQHWHHGSAILESATVERMGLELVPDNDPPRHANIRGWPRHTDLALQKMQRQKAAVALAEESFWLQHEIEPVD